MNKGIKENGRIFKVIKRKHYSSDQYFKHEALDKLGDEYQEYDDGRFINIRTDCITDILKIENFENYFQEQKSVGNQEDGMIDGIIHSDIEATLNEAKETIEYMNSIITELAVSDSETYYNRYANALSLIDQTKASL